eukprot:COSAG03_NODE_434_length_7933_cov_12.379755_7_plen_727_part_00
MNWYFSNTNIHPGRARGRGTRGVGLALTCCVWTLCCALQFQTPVPARHAIQVRARVSLLFVADRQGRWTREPGCAHDLCCPDVMVQAFSAHPPVKGPMAVFLGALPRGLRSIKLSRNELTLPVVEELAEGLKRLTALRRVDVSGNAELLMPGGLKFEAMQILKDNTPAGCAIVPEFQESDTLDWSGKATVADVDSLIMYLKDGWGSTTLRRLDLSGNGLKLPVIQGLAEGLKKLRASLELDLSQNDICLLAKIRTDVECTAPHRGSWCVHNHRVAEIMVGPNEARNLDPAAMMAAAMAEVDDEEEDGAAKRPLRAQQQPGQRPQQQTQQTQQTQQQTQQTQQTQQQTQQTQLASGIIAVTFTAPGTLGLKFTPNKQTGHIELLQVNPGTQAERHPQLSAGLILQSVAGESVADKEYQDVLGMIKKCGRPLSLSFSPGGTVASGSIVSRAAAAAPSAEISAVFTEAGALGLKFTPNKQTGHVEVLAINPGTQAERHPELRPGLVLTEVDGQSVVGIGYPPTLALIKKAGRPVTLRFTPGGTVAAAVAATPADPTEGLTGAAAQRAFATEVQVKYIDTEETRLLPIYSDSGDLLVVADKADIEYENTLYYEGVHQLFKGQTHKLTILTPGEKDWQAASDANTKARKEANKWLEDGAMQPGTRIHCDERQMEYTYRSFDRNKMKRLNKHTIDCPAGCSWAVKLKKRDDRTIYVRGAVVHCNSFSECDPL